MSWLGPSFMKIWTCGSSPRSGSRNAWTRIKNIDCASRLSNFWNFFSAIQIIPSWLVTMDETWLYHYEPETKQQSMEWRHSCSPRPKKFWVQKSTASSSLIIFQRAKLSMQSITHLCWCNWRTFYKKNATGRSPRGSCSCTRVPRLTRHLQPRRNWPTWASNVLTTHPILRTWPHQTTTCSMDWKNNWNVAIFCPMRWSLLPKRSGWTNNLLNFFWVACKS